MHSPGCINTLPSCQTLITLIKESVISSRKTTLSFQQRCSLTYSNNIVFLHSPGCINILPTCQTLITLITLITESDISSRKITLTLSFQQRYLLTCSYNIAFLYSLCCINILPSRETLITLITLITESVISSRKVKLTLSFRRRNLLTCSYDIVSLYPPGCINILPTCRTLITLITESFMSSPKLTLARYEPKNCDLLGRTSNGVVKNIKFVSRWVKKIVGSKNGVYNERGDWEL